VAFIRVKIKSYSYSNVLIVTLMKGTTYIYVGQNVVVFMYEKMPKAGIEITAT